MAPTTRLLGAAILFCSLVVASSRDLRSRRSIEHIADGCRIGKTIHYVCCFECSTCAENGVKDVPACRNRRLVDYWDTKRDTDLSLERRLAELFDTKREEADYWEDKREVDYWQEKREVADYWQDKREAADYWQDKRAPKCRVKVEEGVHRCCVRRNGCACPRDVVARCG